MSESELHLVFPDGPRSELDRLLAELVDTAQRVLATQGRLRSLLKATQAVVTEVDLEVVLRTIVEAAVDLVGARYGALGVIAPDGHLERFIHVGMPAELVAHIGHLPLGKGVLGALIDDPRPIRLEHLSGDPRAAGFPEGHPPMDSFVGVPVRVRNEVYGNLYLTEQSTGSFSAEDEELLMALAATAGIVIDNARLFDETRRRQLWSAASAEVSSALQSDDTVRAVELLLERVAELSQAQLVTLVLQTGDSALIVDSALGATSTEILGRVYDRSGTLVARSIDSDQPVLSEGGENDLATLNGPSMAVPLSSSGTHLGVLVVSRAGDGARFTTADLEIASDFAGQASLALELARGRTARQRLALLNDRGRIARDLHDHVIQRLFGTGLGLQALSAQLDGEASGQVADAVASLDEAIAEIRTAIFSLKDTGRTDRVTLRHQVIDLVTELTEALPSAPRVVLSGPIDTLVDAELASDVVATVREALSNVARHARAEEIGLTVTVTGEQLMITVTDDGVGPAGATRDSGLANLRERAERWNGESSLEARSPTGSVFTWSAHLSTSTKDSQ